MKAILALELGYRVVCEKRFLNRFQLVKPTYVHYRWTCCELRYVPTYDEPSSGHQTEWANKVHKIGRNKSFTFFLFFSLFLKIGPKTHVQKVALFFTFFGKLGDSIRSIGWFSYINLKDRLIFAYKTPPNSALRASTSIHNGLRLHGSQAQP